MKKLFCLICILLIFKELGNAAPFGIPQYFHAQASQDAFVFTLLYGIEKKVDQGYYLEIGSGHPVEISNSYFLEKHLNWKGISLDILTEYREPWSKLRQNPLLLEDATQVDYSSLLQSFPEVIDYLSLDIDELYEVVLQQIPFDQHTFKVITIEHDYYRFGDVYRQREREILTSLGYYLLCPDVLHVHVGSFEDWWIHPSVFSKEGFAKLRSMNLHEKYHDEIVSILNASI